jgi:hypothetical protein
MRALGTYEHNDMCISRYVLALVESSPQSISRQTAFKEGREVVCMCVCVYVCARGENVDDEISISFFTCVVSISILPCQPIPLNASTTNHTLSISV